MQHCTWTEFPPQPPWTSTDNGIQQSSIQHLPQTLKLEPQYLKNKECHLELSQQRKQIFSKGLAAQGSSTKQHWSSTPREWLIYSYCTFKRMNYWKMSKVFKVRGGEFNQLLPCVKHHRHHHLPEGASPLGRMWKSSLLLEPHRRRYLRNKHPHF